MAAFRDPISLSPEEFECEVKRLLTISGTDLSDFRTAHRERLNGADGTYEIDVTVRFSALGANFVVLVECKNQQYPVKREAVQILRDRLQSVGAHKGIMFATTTFQKGAIEYAEKHGIALVRLTEWNESWVAFSDTQDSASHRGAGYTGWLVRGWEEGDCLLEHLTPANTKVLTDHLFARNQESG